MWGRPESPEFAPVPSTYIPHISQSIKEGSHGHRSSRGRSSLPLATVLVSRRTRSPL